MAYIDGAAHCLLAFLNGEPAGLDHVRCRNESGILLPIDTDTRLRLLKQLNLVASHCTLFDADGMPNDSAQPAFEQFIFYTAEIYPRLASHDIAVSLPGDSGSDERLFPNGKRIPGWILAYDHQPWVSGDRAIKILMAHLSDAKLMLPKYEDMYWTWETALSDAIARTAISVTTISGKQMLSHIDISAWCKQHGYAWPLEAPANAPVETAPVGTGAEDSQSSEPSATPRPLQQQVFQEQEILRVLAEFGHDPLNLPKSPAGQPGVKAEVRKKLNWQGSTTFDKAWERLRRNKELADAR
ncbi:hypothetical protein [Paraburkholderia kururiensis]|uniref:Uncharacterized protein n=1 Tax=Paraburkholderia kururiensis TaxID=984307 RepID=A0ABZ0WEZ3_9BURK|nr:hypothetical protein [Paraburkholderia kururiensis]WQD75892.1 hypothetical protein U0042_17365 [Paraburkholderia kururiensis]